MKTYIKAVVAIEEENGRVSFSVNGHCVYYFFADSKVKQKGTMYRHLIALIDAAPGPLTAVVYCCCCFIVSPTWHHTYKTREDLLVSDDVNAQGYDLPSQVAIDMILDYPIDHGYI